jgi:hypothetical protein
MIGLLCSVPAVWASPFKSKIRLVAENAALRHQLIVFCGASCATASPRTSRRCAPAGAMDEISGLDRTFPASWTISAVTKGKSFVSSSPQPAPGRSPIESSLQAARALCSCNRPEGHTHPTSAVLSDAWYFAKRVTLNLALRSSGDTGRGFGRVGAATALVSG